MIGKYRFKLKIKGILIAIFICKTLKMEPTFNLKKILIAVDSSEYSLKAAKYAFALAEQTGAEIAFIHVNDFPVISTMTSSDPFMADGGVIMPEMMEIQQQNSEKVIKNLKAEIGITTETKDFIVTGNAKDEIVNVADEWNAGMIVLGTHGRTGFDHFISGSVAESVSRHASCPVLIIPNKKDQ